MCYYIGILGYAANSSAVLIGEDGSLQRHARSPAGMEWRDGRYGLAAQTARQLIEELARLHDLPFSTLIAKTDTIMICLSGLDTRHVYDRFLGQLKDYQFRDSATKIASLAEAAYLGAFHCQPGLVIRSGHGSSAFLKTANGATRLIGGWGQMLGDHGSGMWLGKKVLQLLTRHRDGLAAPNECTFCKDLVRTLFKDDFDEADDWTLLPFLRFEAARSAESDLGVRKYLTEVGKLTTMIAEGGDPIALGLVELAHRHLVNSVNQSVKQAVSNGEKLPICLRGSLFETSDFFRRGLLTSLFQTSPSICMPPDGRNGAHSPLVGAGLLAIEPKSLERSSLNPKQAKFVTTADQFSWSRPKPSFISIETKPPKTLSAAPE